MALSAGCSASASIAQRATIGSAVAPGSELAFACLRAASTRAMSASIHVVHVAAVSSERFMCAPIALRMRESWPAGSGSAPVRTLGVQRLRRCAASTSCLRMRPPAPVPITDDRSTPCSAASRETTGGGAGAPRTSPTLAMRAEHGADLDGRSLADQHLGERPGSPGTGSP